MRTLRIAIATSGRFHVLDLARELVRVGHDVRLYSMLPHKRVEMFGLDRKFHRSLFPLVSPLAGWQRYFPGFYSDVRDQLLSRALDSAVTRILGPCDVFICMSGIFLAAARHAAESCGAKVWVERGSRHILSQAEILKAVPGARVPSEWTISRELELYQLADRIVVPSKHAAESFQRDARSASKLFVNPYGVDLSMFPYRARRNRKVGAIQLIFAGNWSLQKGCDVLVKAVGPSDDVEIHHYGLIGDCSFPTNDSRFFHHGAVMQSELSKEYARYDGLIQPSRQEGLSLVLSQALASGLPVIATDRTGSDDLAHTPRLRERIFTVPHDDPIALRNGILGLRKRMTELGEFSSLDISDLRTLSWQAYATRYSTELLQSIPMNPNSP